MSADNEDVNVAVHEQIELLDFANGGMRIYGENQRLFEQHARACAVCQARLSALLDANLESQPPERREWLKRAGLFVALKMREKADAEHYMQHVEVAAREQGDAGLVEAAKALIKERERILDLVGAALGKDDKQELERLTKQLNDLPLGSN